MADLSGVKGILTSHKRSSFWRKGFFVTAAMVVFVTTYLLILPAITLEGRLVCGLEEHTHTEECYHVERTLSCGLEESPGHQHTADCYETVRTLTCTEEGEEHTHTDDCYTTEEVLCCGQEEYEGHTHTDDCYTETRELVCGKEEHVHTEDCYVDVPEEPEEEVEENEEAEEAEEASNSDSSADVESWSDWERTLDGIELTGKWSEDVITVAESQLGYRESVRNYQIVDGHRKGYTRYGAWYGVPYGDWCAMFCSFCLHYAQVDTGYFPQDASCPNWIRTLSRSDYELYHSASSGYEPKRGDLIFFNWNSVSSADHVGLVAEVQHNEDDVIIELRTIEGNSGNQVRYRTYRPNDDRILGYGELPENPELEKEEPEEEPEESVEEKTSGPVTLSAWTEDGVQITLTGDASSLPWSAESLTLKAERLDGEEAEALEQILNQDNDEEEVEYKTAFYDLIILHQPELDAEQPDAVPEADEAADDAEVTEEVAAEDEAEATPVEMAAKTEKAGSADLSAEPEVVEPAGPVTLSFQGVEMEAETLKEPEGLKVYQMNEDNQLLENRNYMMEDAAITLDTDDVSIYGISLMAINETTITTASQFANLANGGDFVLGADLTISSTVTISRTTTLDLNGHKLTVSANPLFNITGGSLTLTDSSDETIPSQAVSGAPYGNTASYNNGSLTYYVTETQVTKPDTGATTETVKRCTVSNAGMIIGNTNNGRAITISGGTLNLEGGYICNFTSADDGGAIYATGGTINQRDTVLAANTAGRGGAIGINGNATLDITGGVISGNRSNGNALPNNENKTNTGGAGIYSNNGNITMSNGYVTNNVAVTGNYFDGGGGFLLSNASLNLSGGYLTGNEASGGGGIKTWRSRASSISMCGGFITANHSTGAEGGGVNLDSGGNLYFTAGYVTNNIAGGGVDDSGFNHWGGGGLFCCDGNASIEILNALITENAAGGFGGGVAGCSTGRINIVMDEGGAIFDNAAQGVHVSSDESAKDDDRVYALNDPVFMANGYQDFYCALSSSVSGGMLGGGTAHWTGSADGSAITSNSRSDVLEAAYIMGLTAQPSNGDKSNAEQRAYAYINGNKSPTHGGGILANGFLVIGDVDEIENYCRLELNASKKLLNTNGEPLSLSGHEFQFIVTDAYGNEVTTGANDASGNIIFQDRIPFTKAGTFTFYIYELTPEDGENEGVLPDTSRFKMEVTIERVLDGSISYAGGTIPRYRYQFNNVKITETESGNVIYNKNPGNNDTHAVELDPTGGNGFTNYKVDKTKVSVKKEWKGGTPKPITVNLLRNGETYQQITLNSSNNWAYTWNDLPVTGDNGEYYAYSAREEAVEGYLGTYSTTTNASYETYWVRVGSDESLTPGTNYVILHNREGNVLNVTSSHTNATLDNTDVAGARGRKTSDLHVGEKIYNDWYEGNVFQKSSVFTPDTYGGKTILRNVGYDYVWLGQEDSGGRLKTTSNGSASCAQYACEARLVNGTLQLRQGHVTGSENRWRTVCYRTEDNSNYFDVAATVNYPAQIYKEISSAVATETIITITNTPIEDIYFTLNIHKVSAENEHKVLKDAKFELYDSTDTKVSFTQAPDTKRYTRVERGTAGAVTVLTSDANGNIRVDKLPGGIYTLKEIDAPDGYGEAADQRVELNERTPSATLSIIVADPEQSYELPETGGVGTTLYTLGGAILMIFALMCGFYIGCKREGGDE